MADSAYKISVLKAHLRRTKSLEELTALSLVVANKVTKFVTLTGTASEGASGSGILTFEPVEYLGAIEEIILEKTPAADLPEQPSAFRYADDSGRYIQT